MSGFVHLHLHTQYSVLDGANKISNVVAQAKKLGQSAVAMTDHGNMHGAIEFYSEARAQGVQPIIGCEVYITSGSRLDRRPVSQGGPTTHHLTLLAMNYQGYANLCRLVTIGYTEGFYHKPRIDRELLAQFNEGIICLSGCVSGELSGYAMRDDIEGARTFLKQQLEIFGDRYYLEVQPHQFREQQLLNAMCRELGSEFNVPLVATNDCHYLESEDHYAQEVLMCVSTGKLMTDEERIQHKGVYLHFKDYAEMCAELPDFEEAIRCTEKIAQRCNIEFDFSTYHMPQYEPPVEKSLEQHFAEEAIAGMERRYLQLERRGIKFSDEKKVEYQQRLEEEIELIKQMGFAGYFLVVSDFILWAKNNDVPVGPGRGSAAGSLVAYAMYITEIDPIENKLLFERFLNPERISMPDIDIDFCINGRERVIEYVCDKYGRDKVAQIVTFGTLKAKAAIKDVGRVLGLSYAETDRIAKLIPAPRQGFDYPIAEALKMEKRLREFAEGEGKELIGLAQKLEGLSRHTSTHAAGLVISDKPIVEYLPLMVDRDGQIVTQFSMSWVEKIGLVKFDFLGLKTLSVLHEAVRMMKKDKVVAADFDINDVALNDERTYKTITAGRTIGVFQLESSGITEMVTRLKPNCFEDLVAILALYRPGPLDAGMVDHYINRKHGREPVKMLHPILEPILRDTYGIILYQEQIMQIAREMGGYTLGQADMLRRAMGKKKPEEMAKHRKTFIVGATERGVAESVSEEVFNQMETFARYGFNRSHSVAYALISYQTGYLKTHYPRHFMAALMTFEMGDTDKTLKNLNECREMSIVVTPPNVNEGSVGFSVVNDQIVFGLAAIKGIGEKVVEQIIAECETKGEFASLLNFCSRLDSSLLNKRVLENFIKSGGFDWTGLSRAELIERYEEVLRIAQKERAEAMSNQMGLFGSAASSESQVYDPRRELLPEWPVNIRLAREKEALGFYLSGHPLEKYREELIRLGTISIADLRTRGDGSVVTVAGVITALRLKNTKKGDRYATFTLEDLLDTIEVIIWPDVYSRVAELLESDDPVLISAKLDANEDRRQLIAQEVESALAIRERTAKEAVVRLTTSECSPQNFKLLKKVLSEHQGRCCVKLVVHNPKHSETVVKLPDNIAIDPSEALCNKVEQLFGKPVMSFRS